MKNLLTFLFLSGIILPCDMVIGMSNKTENNSGPGGLVYSLPGEGQSPIATGAASFHKKSKPGIIYKVTNLINGKIYIGMSLGSLKRRKQNHLSAAIAGNSKYIFHSAIRKYEEENFKWEVIDGSLFFDSLCELEKKYILKFNCKVPCGYNLTDGGDGTRGFICSDETRIKRRLAMLGKPKSAGHIKKMSAASMGNKHFLGRHHSKETIDKMRKAQLGIKNHNFGKHIPWTQKRVDAENLRRSNGKE